MIILKVPPIVGDVVEGCTVDEGLVVVEGRLVVVVEVFVPQEVIIKTSDIRQIKNNHVK
jgi:hypothetical protein